MLRSTISLATAVELHVAARGQEREPVLDLPLDVRAAAAEQRPEAPVEPELACGAADEVEHGADRLAGRLPQPASELLEEQRRALGRAQHQQRVDGRNVDALVEQVDGEDDADAPAGQVAQSAPGARVRRVARDGDARRRRAR